jgi:hypothetical protein
LYAETEALGTLMAREGTLENIFLPASGGTGLRLWTAPLKPTQLENAQGPMLVMPAGSLRLPEKPPQYWNA